jgi:hypothetical protein
MAQAQKFDIDVPGMPGVRLAVTVEVIVDAPQPKPDVAEIAALITDGYTREQIAQRYARQVRTVERWMAQAREAYPDIPRAVRGRPATRTTDSTR